MKYFNQQKNKLLFTKYVKSLHLIEKNFVFIFVNCQKSKPNKTESKSLQDSYKTSFQYTAQKILKPGTIYRNVRVTFPKITSAPNRQNTQGKVFFHSMLARLVISYIIIISTVGNTDIKGLLLYLQVCQPCCINQVKVSQ